MLPSNIPVPYATTNADTPASIVSIECNPQQYEKHEQIQDIWEIEHDLDYNVAGVVVGVRAL